MKHKSVLCWISLWMLLFCLACDPVTRDARHLIRQGSLLLDTDPDSTLLLIDSVMRMEAKLSDRERVEMALLQGKALYGGSLCPDEGRSIPPMVVPLPELDDAPNYFAARKDHGKTALTALYKGRSLLEGEDKAAAVQAFKKAEQYGWAANDTLTVARAQYWIGKTLYDDGIKNEALTVLSQADQNFGDHYDERAMTQNVMAAVLILMTEYDSAAVCLDQAIRFSELGGCDNARHKALNNYAVLLRLTGKYELAKEKLRIDGALSDPSRIPIYYINMGNICLSGGQIDSAGYYFDQLESILPEADIKDETSVSAYRALSQYYELIGDAPRALDYRHHYDKYLSKVQKQRDQNRLYITAKKYDYDRIRQMAYQDTLLHHRWTSVLIALLAVLIAALLVIYYQLIQRKLKEAKTDALLVRMMNQQRELLQNNEQKERKNQEVIQDLTLMLTEKLKTMQKLEVFIKAKNATALSELKSQVFADGDHLEQMMQIIDMLYPGAYKEIQNKYPEMSEMECKVCLLQRFKLTRDEEASILGVGVSVLDKIRGRVRKKTQEKPEKRS